MNYWDKANMVAGEVEDADRNFSRAIFGMVALVVWSYLASLLAGTGAMGWIGAESGAMGILRRSGWRLRGRG